MNLSRCMRAALRRTCNHTTEFRREIIDGTHFVDCFCFAVFRLAFLSPHSLVSFFVSFSLVASGKGFDAVPAFVRFFSGMGAGVSP